MKTLGGLGFCSRWDLFAWQPPQANRRASRSTTRSRCCADRVLTCWRRDCASAPRPATSRRRRACSRIRRCRRASATSPSARPIRPASRRRTPSSRRSASPKSSSCGRRGARIAQANEREAQADAERADLQRRLTFDLRSKFVGVMIESELIRLARVRISITIARPSA